VNSHIIIGLTAIGIMGCASTAPPLNNPIVPVKIVCSQSAQMSSELEHIIRNPNSNIGNWVSNFARLSGYQTAEQRTSSAKTVLWTIRTQCPGY